MNKQLSTLMPGILFLYRERGAVVLEHTGGGVLVQLIDSIGKRKFGPTNDWRTSDLANTSTAPLPKSFARATWTSCWTP